MFQIRLAKPKYKYQLGKEVTIKNNEIRKSPQFCVKIKTRIFPAKI
jgi:hypothetical protein